MNQLRDRTNQVAGMAHGRDESLTLRAIVLAAGQSRRLGQPKQLLSFRQRSLVRQAVDNAFAVDAKSVTVVTGAYREAVQRELASSACDCVFNSDWNSGMGSSLACGSKWISDHCPDTDAILIQVCDQPLIPVAHLQTLVAITLCQQTIAATMYSDRSSGIPACFPGNQLSNLAALAGRMGARSLIRSQKHQCVPCDRAEIDIDISADLTHLADQSE